MLRSAFRVTRHRKPFAVDAMVVLPEHLHAILTLPPGDSDFSGRWKAAKARFTRAVIAVGTNVPRDNRGGYLLWQARFWEHTVRDDGDFERLHGLVSSPREWPFSSFHRFARAGMLPRDWAGDDAPDAAGFGERVG